jgi:hypothetical protein
MAIEISEVLAYWFKAQVYLDRIKQEKGIDIKGNDNRYHCATKTGRKKTSVVHRYSPEFVDLIERIRKGDTYELTCESREVSAGKPGEGAVGGL